MAAESAITLDDRLSCLRHAPSSDLQMWGAVRYKYGAGRGPRPYFLSLFLSLSAAYSTLCVKKGAPP